MDAQNSSIFIIHFINKISAPKLFRKTQMNITLDTLIELIEDSMVQIEFQTDEKCEKDFYDRSSQDTYKVKYVEVIDASQLLEYLYKMKTGV